MVDDIIRNLRAAVYRNDSTDLTSILSDPVFLKHPLKNSEIEYLYLNACDSTDQIKEILLDYLSLSTNQGDIVQDLKVALIQGNMQMSEQILANGVLLDGQIWNEHSPARFIFSSKIIQNRPRLLDLLISHGMNTNYCTANGENLLHILLYFSDVGDENFINEAELVEILLRSRVPINEVNEFGKSPLWDAVEKRKLMMTRFLVEQGADINIRDVEGWTPIFMACENHDENIIRFLLENRATINLTDIEGRTPYSRISSDAPSYNECVMMIVKEIAKISFSGGQKMSLDFQLIQCDEKVEWFEACVAELSLMSNTMFYETYSYFSILTGEISSKKIEKFIKHRNFLDNCRKKIRSFMIYRNELKKIFERAVSVYNKAKIVG